MGYTSYSERIDCNVNDKVYVYTKDIFDKDGKINEDMIGVVESFEQEVDEAWDGMQYLSYTADIRLKNGEPIKIKDDSARPFFRKHEFITAKDLKRIYNIEINK
ncbi:MAG: hypothetical protein ACE3L7_25545 [Candidatus Pristimantibacillus sp.]